MSATSSADDEYEMNMKRGYAQMRSLATLVVPSYSEMYRDMLEMRRVCDSVLDELASLGQYVNTTLFDDVREQALFLEHAPYHTGPALLERIPAPRVLAMSLDEEYTPIRAWLREWRSNPSYLLQHYDVQMEQAGVGDTLDDKIRYWFYTLPRLYSTGQTTERVVKSPVPATYRRDSSMDTTTSSTSSSNGSDNMFVEELSENSEIAYIRAVCMYLGIKRRHYQCYYALNEAFRVMHTKNSTFTDELETTRNDVLSDVGTRDMWQETLLQPPNYGRENSREAEYVANPAATLVRFLKSAPGKQYWQSFARRRRMNDSLTTLTLLVDHWGAQTDETLSEVEKQLVSEPDLIDWLIQWSHLCGGVIRRTLLRVQEIYNASFVRYRIDQAMHRSYNDAAERGSPEGQLNAMMLSLHQMATIMLSLFEFERRLLDDLADDEQNVPENSHEDVDCTWALCAVQLRVNSTAHPMRTISNPLLRTCRALLLKSLGSTLNALCDRTTTRRFLRHLLANAVSAQVLIDDVLLLKSHVMWLVNNDQYTEELLLTSAYRAADRAFNDQMVQAVERALDQVFPEDESDG